MPATEPTTAAPLGGSVAVGGPPSDPVQYSLAEYIKDKADYEAAVTSNNARNAALKRNDMVYGIMADIEVKYAHDYKGLFGRKNGFAVTGDFATLGLTSAGAIATNAATKTIFAALGTGISGLNLSIEKNYYSQQSFQVIAVAMQTGRKKKKKQIVASLAKSVDDYPFNAAREDLQSLVLAGTLPKGLEELQEEASNAAKEAANPSTGKPLDAPGNFVVQAGIEENTLVWAPVIGAKSYNIYRSDKSGVTISSTKLAPVTNPYFSDSGASHDTTYHYSVTAVNDNGESPLAGEQSATSIQSGVPAAPAAPGTPTNVKPQVVSGTIVLSWTASPGAVTFEVRRGTTAALAAAAAALANPFPTQNLYVDSNAPPGTLFYVVTAINGAGVSSGTAQSAQVTSPTLHLQ